MFIINPDPYTHPDYRISPFKTRDVAFNMQLKDDVYAESHFNKKFGKGNWVYTYNGREAIKMALATYQLTKNDIVTILTTSENFYISSCVTKEIEQFCNWNREIIPETTLIFVNHEFGYPYPTMEKVVATGLPIIEDCCTTFFSQDTNNRVGSYGDFTVYSFPKFFPIQIGGVLVSNTKIIKQTSTLLDKEHKNYIQKVVSYNLKNKVQLLQKREENFKYAVSKFVNLGFTERFENTNKIVPNSLMLNNNSIIKDLNTLKTFLWNHGVQSSVFYGEDAFFIPNHQSLSKIDIDYFFAIINEYILKYNR